MTSKETELVEKSETKDKLKNEILQLEEIDTNLYRANYLWKTIQRGVYGGQIIGQALVASAKTVPKHLHIHSVHCYFLLRGNNDDKTLVCVGIGDGLKPIIYEVEIMRDGRSFSTRRVNAKQNGQIIFTCILSYQRTERAAITHQYKMPAVPSPESLPHYEDIFSERLKSGGSLTDQQRLIMSNYLKRPITFVIKPVNQSETLLIDSTATFKRPKLLVWIKLKESIEASDQALHRCAVAYISDSFILHAYLLFANNAVHVPPAMVASLDHSIWFHDHFQADEWMLYECESPKMIGNRALYFGRIWKRDGTLAVSVAQEFLVRINSKI